MWKKHKFKIRYLLVAFLFFGLFAICPGLSSRAAMVQPGVNQDAIDETLPNNSWGYIEDTSIFDVKWGQGQVETWIRHKTWWFGTKHKTGVALRITYPETGELINNITMIHAKVQFTDGTVHVIEKKWDGYNDGFLKWGNINSKDGEFCSFYGQDWKEKKKKKAYNEWSAEFANFRECNYRWDWNYDVEKFIALYVWYPNPKTNEIEAVSFYPNGEHPRFDEKGQLIGIFDAENNICNDLKLNDIGIIENTITGEEQISFDDQNKGVKYQEKSSFSDFLGALFESNPSSISFVSKLALIFQMIIFLLVGGLVVWLVIFLGKKIYKAVKS